MSNKASPSSLITFLCDPASYGSSATSVVHHETHASHIFLVGDAAYKLKKPLYLDFIDARDPLRRRKFCRDEILLNQRFAPRLYESIIGVKQFSNGSFTLSPPEDSCIDFLVKMRRFNDDDLFTKIIECGEDDREKMERFALALAEVHLQEQPRPEYPAVAVLEKLIKDNIAQIPSDGENRARIEALKGCLLARYATMAPLMKERSNTFVKQLHGDLHTRNICLFEGELVAFDGIEFNPDLNTIDTMLDLSFLVMDLIHLKAYRAVSIILSTYLRSTSDYFGLSLLPLFISYRATIRAKIEALGPAGWGNRGDKYLLLAEKTILYQQPILFVVGGLSGAGKSTIAQIIGEAIGGIVIRSDFVRKEIFGGSLSEKAPAIAYQSAATEQVYHELITRTAAALESGLPVIVDATFINREHQLLISGLAHTTGAKITPLWCHCSSTTAANRIAKRSDDPSDATISIRIDQERKCVSTPSDWIAFSTEGTVAEVNEELRRLRIIPWS
jgi:aminoglycoside phosphotransferase family enzyme/predicted kinase